MAYGINRVSDSQSKEVVVDLEEWIFHQCLTFELEQSYAPCPLGSYGFAGEDANIRPPQFAPVSG